MKLEVFKPENYIRNDEERLIYLRDALDSGDPKVISAALGTVARSHNMAALARSAGVSRATLYKSLSSDGNPTLSVLMPLLKEMNLKIDIVQDKVV